MPRFILCLSIWAKVTKPKTTMKDSFKDSNNFSMLQERTLTGQTGLHLAAERDFHEITSVLLSNNIDFTAGNILACFFNYQGILETVV